MMQTTCPNRYMITAILLLGACATCADERPAAAEVGDLGGERDTSLIRVMHAEIEGQVFLASEDQGIREIPAEDVSVQIRDDAGDRLIAEALTDEAGSYTLPKIDVGRYKLLIGGLRLNMSVEPEDTRWSDELRKVIIAIIPKQMAERE